ATLPERVARDVVAVGLEHRADGAPRRPEPRRARLGLAILSPGDFDLEDPHRDRGQEGAPAQDALEQRGGAPRDRGEAAPREEGIVSSVFPENGAGRAEILAALADARAGDLASDGRAFAFIYDAGEEARALAREAFAACMSINGL